MSGERMRGRTPAGVRAGLLEGEAQRKVHLRRARGGRPSQRGAGQARGTQLRVQSGSGGGDWDGASGSQGPVGQTGQAAQCGRGPNTGTRPVCAFAGSMLISSPSWLRVAPRQRLFTWPGGYPPLPTLDAAGVCAHIPPFQTRQWWTRLHTSLCVCV